MIDHRIGGSGDGRDVMIEAVAEEAISPLGYVVPFQVLAYRLAIGKGVDLTKETFPDFKMYVATRV
ncbi:hypothetical protein LJK88_25775 [Paenibacillus sp. P26]|nr:hypothetical protein LJK88_25775 [Paenibacillus sp. P26]UUZ95182.1 hypothetical protein LJK87_12190 [Paenibacillus sp. P25]